VIRHRISMLIPAATALRGTEQSAPVPAQKRTPPLRKQTVRFQAAASPADKPTVRSHIRPLIGTLSSRPGRTAIEIPIDHRVGPAGSGTADFPTPHGVRNSKRQRKSSFRPGTLCRRLSLARRPAS
jgi:hypothetical protein